MTSVTDNDLYGETDTPVLSHVTMGTTLEPTPHAADRTSTEARVQTAALACVARLGLAKTTLDDVARESGVSRATVYRTFPGGRDALLESMLRAEISRFFDDLAEELAPLDDLEDVLVVGVGASMRYLLTHEALRTVVEREPHLVLPQLALHRDSSALPVAQDFAAPYLRPHLESDVAADRASELLVRIVLSYALQPSPHLDPFDPASVRSFVRIHLLPGLVPPTKESAHD